MKIKHHLLTILAVVTLAACEFEVGYQPKLPIPVPIKITFNSRLQLRVEMSRQIQTEIGIFSLEVGADVYSLGEEYQERVLIIRVDDVVSVYPLPVGEQFQVVFDEANQFYRKVALTYEEDGDIVLELESGQAGATLQPIVGGSFSPTSVTSCPGAPLQRLKINEDAIICSEVDRIFLRDGPGKGYNVLRRYLPGIIVAVIGGPVCADDWSWWEVETEDDYIGWMSEGGNSKDKYFLCPD